MINQTNQTSRHIITNVYTFVNIIQSSSSSIYDYIGLNQKSRGRKRVRKRERKNDTGLVCHKKFFFLYKLYVVLHDIPCIHGCCCCCCFRFCWNASFFSGLKFVSSIFFPNVFMMMMMMIIVH